jgi:ribosomal protein L7Ae-like RNA K-turn-binding protein
VQKAIRAGKAKLIVFASDTSEGSVKRNLHEAEKSATKSTSTPYTKFEFSKIAGKGTPGTLAILDQGLAEEFEKRLKALEN